MAKPFVLTAQINLQAPNARKVIQNITNQLNSINANVNVNIPKATTQQLNKVNQSIQNVGKSAAKAGKDMGKFTGGIRGALTYLVKYDLARTIINGVVDTIRDGTQAAISFEKEMIKVGQVTGKSLGSLQGLQNEIGRLSKTLGVSSSSLVKTSRILAQTGITAGEVKVSLDALAKTTLAATFDDITSTTETAIAAMRQFGFGAKQLETELGRINALAGNFAVEAGDIGVAIKRAGGAFKAAGGQLIELEALFTSVRSTTRETAETIATGFRTIFTRIQRPKTIQFLRQVGVELQDLAGNFVGPFEAVRKLNVALKDLDPRDVRYSQIVEQLGGFRQVSKVIPLIQQFATAQKALSVAQQGGSSLARDAEKAQKGLGNQIAKVKEEFQELFRTLVGSTGFQSMIKLALDLARAMVKVAEAVAPLVPLLATLAVGKGLGFLATGMGRGKGKHEGGRIHKFAAGGSVPGTGNRDTVPAMLTPGEFVIKKSSVKSIGSGNLQKMNKYQGGGVVSAGKAELERAYSSLKNLKDKQGNKTGLDKGKKYSIDLRKHKYNKDSGDGSQLMANLIKAKRRDQGVTNKKMGSIWPSWEKVVATSINRRSSGKSRPLDYPNDPGESKFLSWGTKYTRYGEKSEKGNVDSTYIAKAILDGKTRSKTLATSKGGSPLKINAYYPDKPNVWAGALSSFLPGGKQEKKKNWGDKKLARGGGISGTDTVSAMLTPGEFVVNRQSASRIGYGNLEKANRTGKSPQGFAAGGRVPSSGKSHFGSSPASSNSNDDDSGGGGGGGIALKALLAMDVILPMLADKFKVVDGEISKMSAATDAVSSTMLTLTTVGLLLGDTFKKMITQGSDQVGGKTQAFVGAVAAAGFALGQYVAELGRQQQKAAMFNITEGGGFKSNTQVAASRAMFEKGSSDEARGSGAAYGAGSGAALGAAIGTAILPGIGTAVGAIAGGIGGYFTGGEIGIAFADTEKSLRTFDATVRTLRLGASLESLQASLKQFSEGKASAQRIAGVVSSGVQELASSFARISTQQGLVDFQGAVSKAIPGISEFVNKVAASSDSFLELQNVVGTKTLNAFAQLSGVSLEEMKRSIEESVVVRRKATAAQNAQLLAIQATNKVLRQARNAISAFSAIEQSLTRFDSALDNVGQSISNNFGPASISKMAPQFSDISNIIDFNSFNQQVDNLGTIMGSAGSGLTNDIKQFAQLSNVLPNVLTEAAGEIGIGGARASDIIEKKIIAADPGGIIGDEFRQAIVRRITAMSDMGDGGQGKFAGRIREDIEGVVNDLTKGMKESQNAFQKAAEFIDAANSRLGKAYNLRTKLELNIAKQLSNIIGLQYENSQRIRKAKGQAPDDVGGAIAFAAQQNALLGGTQISGMGTNVRIVSQEFLRLKKKISESNAELSKFGIDATSGVSDLTDSQRSLIDENAKLKEEFAKTQSVLKNYADIQQRVGALQEKISKEQAKRGQVLSAASALAFATDERRAEMGREMNAAQVATIRGIDAIPSSMRAGVLSMLNMFSEVAVFDGKTGSEVKKEIDISYLEKLLGPLTDAQKKLITESTTAEERFINDMKRIQGQAEQAQKALLIGMGDDRKELANTIGNLHRELVSGIKSIFLQQQKGGVEKEISETRSAGTVAQKQLDILKNIQNGGIPVEDPRVLQAVRSNIDTVKALKEARKKEAGFNKIAASTGVIGNNTFQDVKGSSEEQSIARRNNSRRLDNLGGQLRSTLGVDLGNQVTQILRDAMRSENMKAIDEGRGQSGSSIAAALREAMGQFGSMQAGEQRDIISTNMSTLNDAGLGPYINELQNNIEYLGSSLAQLPEGATWATLTGEVVSATSGLVSLNAQLSQIQQNSIANQAAGNAAAAQGGGGGGPVAYAAGGFAPRGTDTVPAMLTPGEFVVNRSAAQRNSGALKAINSGKSQYLAGGGEVQKWFGSTGATDKRFVHKKPETDSINAMIAYVNDNFSANKIDDSGQGQYDILNHVNQDLPGLKGSAWGEKVGIGVPSSKFTATGFKRWKPDGRIVRAIPETNAYIKSGEMPSTDTLYAHEAIEAVKAYKYYVDRDHQSVDSNNGKNTKPGLKDDSASGALRNHYELKNAALTTSDWRGDVEDTAKIVWPQFLRFGENSTKEFARGRMPYNIDALTDPWKIKIGSVGEGTQATETSGYKWHDGNAKKWFNQASGMSTIQQESLDGYGSYVDQPTVNDDYSSTLATSLRKVGTSWEDQLKGVSSTYGHKASTTLKANTAQIQKFLKDGNSGNYQKDFLDSIFNQFNPNGPWAAYSEEDLAYSRGNYPWSNLTNLSTRFMANYTGAGSPASRGKFDFLNTDPTNSRHWDLPKTIGHEIPFYEDMAKERGTARTELAKFFSDRQGMASGDVRYAAAQGMDDFQELIGSKVPNIGMKYVKGQKEERDNKEDQKTAMDESLINDVKTSRAAIKSPLLKTSDFVEKLNVNSKRMRAVNDFTKVPNYAKKAGLRGVRDLQDVEWDSAAIDAVFPFLAKLSNDLKVLVSAGLVKKIDKDGVDFDGGRLYETLSKSFDLIMAGKPDTNFLDVVKPNGQIGSNAFIGSSGGGGLFDRMKMWSRGSSTWYGGLKGGELESMNALFGKDKVSDSVNKMQKQSFSALDSIIKKYDTTKTEPQLLAAGGVAFSPQGTDTVPAMLTPGEFVVNRKSAQANMPLLNSINSGTQYLARGGTVQDAVTSTGNVLIDDVKKKIDPFINSTDPEIKERSWNLDEHMDSLNKQTRNQAESYAGDEHKARYDALINGDDLAKAYREKTNKNPDFLPNDAKAQFGDVLAKRSQQAHQLMSELQGNHKRTAFGFAMFTDPQFLDREILNRGALFGSDHRAITAKEKYIRDSIGPQYILNPYKISGKNMDFEGLKKITGSAGVKTGDDGYGDATETSAIGGDKDVLDALILSDAMDKFKKASGFLVGGSSAEAAAMAGAGGKPDAISDGFKGSSGRVISMGEYNRLFNEEFATDLGEGGATTGNYRLTNKGKAGFGDIGVDGLNQYYEFLRPHLRESLEREQIKDSGLLGTASTRNALPHLTQRSNEYTREADYGSSEIPQNFRDAGLGDWHKLTDKEKIAGHAIIDENIFNTMKTANVQGIKDKWVSEADARDDEFDQLQAEMKAADEGINKSEALTLANKNRAKLADKWPVDLRKESTLMSIDRRTGGFWRNATAGMLQGEIDKIYEQRQESVKKGIGGYSLSIGSQEYSTGVSDATGQDDPSKQLNLYQKSLIAREYVEKVGRHTPKVIADIDNRRVIQDSYSRTQTGFRGAATQRTGEMNRSTDVSSLNGGDIFGSDSTLSLGERAWSAYARIGQGALEATSSVFQQGAALVGTGTAAITDFVAPDAIFGEGFTAQAFSKTGGDPFELQKQTVGGIGAELEQNPWHFAGRGYVAAADRVQAIGSAGAGMLQGGVPGFGGDMTEQEKQATFAAAKNNLISSVTSMKTNEEMKGEMAQTLRAMGISEIKIKDIVDSGQGGGYIANFFAGGGGGGLTGGVRASLNLGKQGVQSVVKGLGAVKQGMTPIGPRPQLGTYQGTPQTAGMGQNPRVGTTRIGTPEFDSGVRFPTASNNIGTPLSPARTGQVVPGNVAPVAQPAPVTTALRTQAQGNRFFPTRKPVVKSVPEPVKPFIPEAQPVRPINPKFDTGKPPQNPRVGKKTYADVETPRANRIIDEQNAAIVLAEEEAAAAVVSRNNRLDAIIDADDARIAAERSRPKPAATQPPPTQTTPTQPPPPPRSSPAATTVPKVSARGGSRVDTARTVIRTGQTGTQTAQVQPTVQPTVRPSQRVSRPLGQPQEFRPDLGGSSYPTARVRNNLQSLGNPDRVQVRGPVRKAQSLNSLKDKIRQNRSDIIDAETQVSSKQSADNLDLLRKQTAELEASFLKQGGKTQELTVTSLDKPTRTLKQRFFSSKKKKLEYKDQLKEYKKSYQEQLDSGKTATELEKEAYLNFRYRGKIKGSESTPSTRAELEAWANTRNARNPTRAYQRKLNKLYGRPAGSKPLAFATGGSVPRFAAGGQLPARGTDTVPAMLTPGEFVIRKSAVDAVGLGTLNNINSMGSGYGAKSGSGYLVHGGLHDPAKDSVKSAKGLAQVASQQLVLSEILQANKQTNSSIKQMTRAFQERKESRAQPSPTPYTLDSALFTTAVGMFDESVNRLDTIMKRGIIITHKHDTMQINMTVDGNVAATTDTGKLLNTIRSAVANGINAWSNQNGMNDMNPAVAPEPQQPQRFVEPPIA